MKSWTTPYILWLITRNGGKALSLDTKIPTPYGFKTMGELQVGDYVLDEQGKPTKIQYVSDIFYDHKCYEVEFEDGEKIIADADHLWYVKVKDQGNDFKVIATKDMVNKWMSEGKVLEQSSGNYIYISKEGVVVFNKSGKMITTYSSQHFDENMTNIIKQIFG
jgi:hypothetical protein